MLILLHQGMDLIEQLDPQGFAAYLKKYSNTICGRHPIAVLLNVSISPLWNLYIKTVQGKHENSPYRQLVFMYRCKNLWMNDFYLPLVELEVTFRCRKAGVVY